MTTAILQARMGSTRLPGKMMAPIFQEKGALELMLERVRHARTLDRVIVATTTMKEDDAIVALCDRLSVPCFRGHPTDVLDRYYQCALSAGADETLVRLTGDCPLHDPTVIDEVVEFFGRGAYDYAANTHPPTYPDGLDTEVFSFRALERAWQSARLPSEREHVTYFIYTHPAEFRLGNYSFHVDLSAMRWTLDEPADLEFMRRVYAILGDKPFGMGDVLDLLERQPELLTLNQHLERNAGLKKSLALDRKLRDPE